MSPGRFSVISPEADQIRWGGGGSSRNVSVLSVRGPRSLGGGDSGIIVFRYLQVKINKFISVPAHLFTFPIQRT